MNPATTNKLFCSNFEGALKCELSVTVVLPL